MIEENQPMTGKIMGVDANVLTEKDKMMIKPCENTQSESYRSCLDCFGSIPKCCCICCAPCGCGPVKTIDEGHEGLIMTLGRYTRKVGPGIHALNPLTETIRIVDMRAQMCNIPAQNLLTKDNVTLTVDAFCQFKITIPELAAFKVKDVIQMIGLMTQGTMKTVFCENTLTELLANRKKIEKNVTELMDAATDLYGIKVVNIGTQKIVLPASMERAMATVAESEKQKAAKIIDAEANRDSAKIFREAADELGKNTISLQLQYFETLKMIAAERNSTILVPDSILSRLSK
jgi:regulator of protease activity HflC (stomatin/prohibitin superfamily)